MKTLGTPLLVVTILGVLLLTGCMQPTQVVYIGFKNVSPVWKDGSFDYTCDGTKLTMRDAWQHSDFLTVCPEGQTSCPQYMTGKRDLLLNWDYEIPEGAECDHRLATGHFYGTFELKAYDEDGNHIGGWKGWTDGYRITPMTEDGGKLGGVSSIAQGYGVYAGMQLELVPPEEAMIPGQGSRKVIIPGSPTAFPPIFGQ